MQLTTAQQTTFRAWLAANVTAQMSDQDGANLANSIASPNYLVWRTTIRKPDVQQSAGFDWTRVDNLSVGKARIWDEMFNQTDSMPPRLGNYRTGIAAVWVGTQADLAVRDAVNAACQRPVTNFEKLFVATTTDGPTQSGTRGTFTNADQLGVDNLGAVIEGNIPAQLVAENRGQS